MDVGEASLNNFQQFLSEARRLGTAFEDRDFHFDENPEIPGLMAMFTTYGGKLIRLIILENHKKFDCVVTKIKN